MNLMITMTRYRHRKVVIVGIRVFKSMILIFAESVVCFTLKSVQCKYIDSIFGNGVENIRGEQKEDEVDDTIWLLLPGKIYLLDHLFIYRPFGILLRMGALSATHIFFYFRVKCWINSFGCLEMSNDARLC